MVKNKAISVSAYMNEKGYADANIKDIFFKRTPEDAGEKKGELSFLEKYENLLSQTTNGYISRI